MHNIRTIKKYPNRRLYDTVESRYITLADLRRLALDQVEFVVIDKKTDEDITNPVLLQVIAEEERSGSPLFSRELLIQLIRSYGSPIRSSIAGYLGKSLTVLLAASDGKPHSRAEHKEDVQQHGAAQRNFERWRALQEEMYRAALADRDTGNVHADDKSVGKERTAVVSR